MLPVSGMTELSAIPSKISPGPPRRRNRTQVETARKNWRWGIIRVLVYRAELRVRELRLRNRRGPSSIQEQQSRRGLERSTVLSIAIKKMQALETSPVQKVMNAIGQIVFDVAFGQA